MAYQVFARKWRPQYFADLVGQEIVLAALRYSLDKQSPHHAYLFTGTRGIGKTTTARIVAKCLNCDKGVSATPCGECRSCVAIRENRFIDLLEIDAASRTRVEDTRELLDNVPYKPTVGRYKIYLIDEVHMLSTHSFNALLKTLEEPPEYIIFLLATTDPQKLPSTILSRCIQFHLQALSVNQIQSRLNYILQQEKITYEETALLPLAVAARGSLRDALSLLDQAVAVGQGKITHTSVSEMLGQVTEQTLGILITAIANRETEKAILSCRDLIKQGADCAQSLERIVEILHQLALTQQVQNLATYDLAEPAFYQALAPAFSPEYLQVCYQIALFGRRDLSLAPYPQLGFEMTILRMLAFLPHKPTTRNSLPASDNITTPTSSPITPAAAVTTFPTAASPPVEATHKWATIINHLQLSGMTQMLAENCLLKTIENKQIILWIHQNHQAFATERQRALLEEALKEHYQRSIKLTIQTTPEPLTTPAMIKDQRAKAQYVEAHQDLQKDEKFQELLTQFNAKISNEIIVTSSSHNQKK